MNEGPEGGGGAEEACGLRAGWGAAELASTRGTETGSNADAASISWLRVKRKELILL